MFLAEEKVNVVEVGGDKLGEGWVMGYQKSFILGQSWVVRRPPDASLTNALHLGLNVDPVTYAVPFTPKSVCRNPVAVGPDLDQTFDFGEGWLETNRASQHHFFILLVISLVWY